MGVFSDYQGVVPTGQGSVTGMADGATYRFLQWVNAEPRAGRDRFAGIGGLFWPLDQVEAGVTPPFKTETMIFGETTKEGYALPRSGVAVLARRLDWGVKDAASNRFIVYNSYKEAEAHGKPTGRTRYVVLMRGAEEAGPVMITMKGVVGRHFDKAVKTFFDSVWRPFNAAFKTHQLSEGVLRSDLRDWPAYGLYVPIKAGPPEKAHPKHSSMISPPILDIPAQALEAQGAVTWAADPKNRMAKEWVTAVTDNDWYTQAQEWAELPVATIVAQDEAVIATAQAVQQRGQANAGYGAARSDPGRGGPGRPTEVPDWMQDDPENDGLPF